MRMWLVFAILCVFVGGTAFAANEGSSVKIPRIKGEYVHVYKPEGDVFPGPAVGELVPGKFYEDWVPNDHCLFRDPKGRWHAFGITGPNPGLKPKNVHAGEYQLFHALAPEGTLKNILKEKSWKDLPKVLPAKGGPKRHGNAIHSPYIVKRDDIYVMIYGPGPGARYAVSKDLYDWTPKGELTRKPGGRNRDPSLLFCNGTYYLFSIGGRHVKMATSTDFKTWEEKSPILQMKHGAPESPSIVHVDGTFYLFTCCWRGGWDKKKGIQGAYQHITYVYQSDDPLHFEKEVATVNAHAPEIFQDEDGDWYISSVEWPNRGVSIARLVWE